MKVQFLWPNWDCPIGLSVGVAYLSGALRAAGHDTSIIHICDQLNYSFDVDRITSDVRSYGPDLIAISTGANTTRKCVLPDSNCGEISTCPSSSAGFTRP